MGSPKFSIITVCLNSRNTIQRTLDSVLQQNFEDFEYIVVDGGSKDGTVEIVKAYDEKFKGRLKIICEKDQGIYDAMNKGIIKSKGKYIGIINSDDWYADGALKCVDQATKLYNFDVVFGLLAVWSNDELVRVYSNFPKYIEKDSLAHPATFISRATYSKYGLYSLEYKSASDYEFFLRICRNEGCKFHYIAKTLANFTHGGISSTSTGYYETLDIKRKNKFITMPEYYFYLYAKKIRKQMKFFK